MVDPLWLQNTRSANQRSLGLAGMGVSADLAAAIPVRHVGAPLPSAQQTAPGIVPAGLMAPNMTKKIMVGALALVGVAVVVGIYRRLRKRK